LGELQRPHPSFLPARTEEEEKFMFEGLFQPMHLLVIFGLALLVFGPKKLPELGKGIGEGLRGFKSAMKGEDEPASASSTPAAAAIKSPVNPQGGNDGSWH